MNFISLFTCLSIFHEDYVPSWSWMIDWSCNVSLFCVYSNSSSLSYLLQFNPSHGRSWMNSSTWILSGYWQKSENRKSDVRGDVDLGICDWIKPYRTPCQKNTVACFNKFAPVVHGERERTTPSRYMEALIHDIRHSISQILRQQIDDKQHSFDLAIRQGTMSTKSYAVARRLRRQ